jgi:hypothetical protein
VAPTFARRHVLFDFVSEKNQPDFVIVTNGGKSQNRSNLGGELAF